MSREEDLIRSTTHAIASAVREVPPLRLEQAPDELGSPAHSPRGGRYPRDWWSWGTPLIAAAAVVVLAVSLVTIKHIPNGRAVPKHPATSTAGPDGAPRYYAALQPARLSFQDQMKGVVRDDIVVGDSLTGQTLATFAPPAHTTFQGVSAAADDRTFAVFAVTSSTGSFEPAMKNGVPVAGTIATLTGSWYVLRLAPGTAHPASLRRLPIKPWPWSDASSFPSTTPGQVIATALSGSGQELAVADIPGSPAAKSQPQDWQEVQVFSVATGQLLHDWIANNPTAGLKSVLGATMATVPVGTPALTWIDGDQALTLATSHETMPAGVVTGTVRRLAVTGPPSGNLMTDGTVIWSGTLSWNDQSRCYAVVNWPPQISADGTAIACVTFQMPFATPGYIDFGTAPLTAGTPADVTPTVGYRTEIPPEKQPGGITLGILWVSPSADSLIVEWELGGKLSHEKAYFGVVSHGKFTSLQIPASLIASGSVSF